MHLNLASKQYRGVYRRVGVFIKADLFSINHLTIFFHTIMMDTVFQAPTRAGIALKATLITRK
jgi:hypothetical protein